MPIQECELPKVTHDQLHVGSLIILPTRSVPRLPGGRMIADRVPSISFSLNLSSSVASRPVSSPLFVPPRLRPNFSDSVTSLLIASLVQLSPVAPNKLRR